MARKKLLSCLKKRDLLNSDKADPSQLRAMGEAYLQQDRISDAIDFFEKAHYTEGLSELKQRCIQEGDFFLFKRLSQILSFSPDTQEWEILGDNALKQGKLLFARAAYEAAGLPEKQSQVERLLVSPPQDQPADKRKLH
ncbi:MAG: hypothetical protein JRJ12_15420 [Deltaproteobacteria bacterium]|nr:hypothetical protein [Deltaproteobacteria bacterium]MBW2072651.1 hypothetical protein [Deltaproteobacteria bacterium]